MHRRLAVVFVFGLPVHEQALDERNGLVSGRVGRTGDHRLYPRHRMPAVGRNCRVAGQRPQHLTAPVKEAQHLSRCLPAGVRLGNHLGHPTGVPTSRHTHKPARGLHAPFIILILDQPVLEVVELNAALSPPHRRSAPPGYVVPVLHPLPEPACVGAVAEVLTLVVPGLATLVEQPFFVSSGAAATQVPPSDVCRNHEADVVVRPFLQRLGHQQQLLPPGRFFRANRFASCNAIHSAASNTAFSARLLVAAIASCHSPKADPCRSIGTRPSRNSSVNGSSTAIAVMTASVINRAW